MLSSVDSGFKFFFLSYFFFRPNKQMNVFCYVYIYIFFLSNLRNIGAPSTDLAPRVAKNLSCYGPGYRNRYTVRIGMHTDTNKYIIYI